MIDSFPETTRSSEIQTPVSNLASHDLKHYSNKLLLAVFSLIVIMFVASVAYWLGTQSTVSDSKNEKITKSENVIPTLKVQELNPPNEVVQNAPTVEFQTYAITHEQTLNLPDYSISVPKEWVIQEHSSNFQNSESFNAPDGSSFLIEIIQNPKNSLTAYLEYRDEIAKTAWEGTPSVTVLSSTPKVFQNFEAVERTEDWHAAAFTTRVTYVSYKDKVFSFYSRPGQMESPNSDVLKNYDSILESFRVTP